MEFFGDIPSWSWLEYTAAFAPIAFGTLYYLAKWIYIYVLRYKPYPLHDPWPARTWYMVSCATAFMAVGGVEVVPPILGGWLLLFLIPLINHDFGEIFT